MKKLLFIPLALVLLASCKKCYECETYILTENFTELNIPDSDCGEYKSKTEAVNSIFAKYVSLYPNALVIEAECFED